MWYENDVKRLIFSTSFVENMIYVLLLLILSQLYPTSKDPARRRNHITFDTQWQILETSTTV